MKNSAHGVTKNNILVTVAAYLMSLIGAGAILNSVFLIPLFVIGGGVLMEGGSVSYPIQLLWILSLIVLNAAQLIFGTLILQNRPDALKRALQYQLIYAILMELINCFVARGAFITSGGFLGVLIIPIILTGLLLIGSRSIKEPAS